MGFLYGGYMKLIHAVNWHQAVRYAARNKLSPTTWNYVSSHDSIRGLRGADMVVLPGAENHKEHHEIMREAALQQFDVVYDSI